MEGVANTHALSFRTAQGAVTKHTPANGKVIASPGDVQKDTQGRRSSMSPSQKCLQVEHCLTWRKVVPA